jgi:hypothetical protein
MSDSSDDPGRAKRERILAVSRTVHSVPVEEGGMMKRKHEAEAQAPPAGPKGRKLALVAGSVAGLALAFTAGLLVRGRRR